MNLLFVCSGNTCRSPMAEALARKIAKRRGIEDLNVSSAGTNAWDNVPATDEALRQAGAPQVSFSTGTPGVSFGSAGGQAPPAPDAAPPAPPPATPPAPPAT